MGEIIQITDNIALDLDDVDIRFVLASGPGGQNVNKLATAAQLRFDVDNAAALPAPMRARLKALAGRRMTKSGVLVIEARRHRTQERNRADAVGRLASLLRAAATPPKPRVPTRAPKGAKLARRQTKARRSALKSLRGRPGADD